MRLQFVLGRAKSGKSHLMYQRMIAESEQNPDRHYVFVVPEQASLSTQQELVSVHPRHALMNVEVMSFKSLAYQVFEELGMRIPTVLDDVGKSMLLRKALISVNDELIIYKGSSRRPGFIDKMKSMIAEMTQYSVDEAVLAKATDGMENAQLSAKLHDISLISKAFNRELSTNYITAESILPELAKCAKDSAYLKNAVLVFDGFSDFTPAQYEVLAELLNICKEIYVVLDMSKEMLNASRGENALFHLPRTIIDGLSFYAEKAGIAVEEPIWLPARGEKEDYYGNGEMRFLERTFEQTQAVFSESTENIFFMEASNPEKEVEQVIAHIISLARDEGYSYHDMAIITTNIETYGDVLEKKLMQAQIPFFSDNRHSIMGNVGVEIVLSALLCADENFSYESVFRYLKCGMFSDMAVIDLMENYCIASGISGKKKFERKWEWKPSFISEDDLELINTKKNELLEPLFKLNENIKGRLNVTERLNALRSFLESISFDEKMLEFGDEMETKGEVELSQEYAQIGPYIEKLFSQMDEMIGGEKMSLKELCEIIESSLAAVSVGVIPPTVDNLVIADMRRSRLESVKAVFVIGMNDGVFPAQKGGAGILSDIDREELKTKNVTLAPTAKKESFADKFYIYRSLTKPECRLYLSYSRQSEEGKKLHPSYVCGQIKRIFPKITHVAESDKIYHVRQGLEVLAGGEADAALREFYRSRPEYLPVLGMIDAGKNIRKRNLSIDGETAGQLFGTRVTSVSHLEKFAACSMSHFLRYGLRLNERQEHELRALDFGNLYHDAFDIIFREVKKEGEVITDLSPKRLEELTELGINRALENFSSDIFESSSKNEYTLARMRDVLKLNLEAVIGQLNAGKYEPVRTEMTFGMRGSDENPPLQIEGSPYALMGKIDRLDEARASDGTLFARVVDYKTGGTEFDYTKLVNGLQLQTMLYLSTIVDTGADVHPAGAFYYHVDEPIVELDEGEIVDLSDEQIKAMVHEKQLAALRMNGVLNTEGESLELFETGIGAGDDSKVLAGLKLKNDGNFTAKSPVTSGDVMNSLMDIAKEQTIKLGKGILNGDVDTNPYLYGDKKPCMYCEYSQICGFNTAFPGYKYRRISKRSILEATENSDGS